MIIWDLIKIKSLFYTCFLITNIRKPIMIPNNKMFTKTSNFLFEWDGPLNDKNWWIISRFQNSHQKFAIITQCKVASLDIFTHKRNKTIKSYSLQKRLNASMVHKNYQRISEVNNYTNLSECHCKRINIIYPFSTFVNTWAEIR